MTKIPDRIQICRHNDDQGIISIKAEGAGVNDEALAMVYAVHDGREAAAERIVASWNARSERRAMYAAQAPISLDDARWFLKREPEYSGKNPSWRELFQAISFLRFQYADAMLAREASHETP